MNSCASSPSSSDSNSDSMSARPWSAHTSSAGESTKSGSAGTVDTPAARGIGTCKSFDAEFCIRGFGCPPRAASSHEVGSPNRSRPVAVASARQQINRSSVLLRDGFEAALERMDQPVHRTVAAAFQGGSGADCGKARTLVKSRRAAPATVSSQASSRKGNDCGRGDVSKSDPPLTASSS